MAKKIKGTPEYSIYDLEQLHLEKCDCCKGKGGKNKDIYKTLEFAMDTIKHLEKERNIYLNPYLCPYGNGYHLTKNNADTEIKQRKKIIFQNNGIPLKSSNQSEVLWEYENVEDNEEKNIEEEYRIHEEINNRKQETPIIKVLPEENNSLNIIEGKVIEIIDKIDIEKYFNVNLENVICANIFKELLKDTICQTTIYTNFENKDRKNSFTILVEKRILKQNKVEKGNIIKVNIKCKSYNNIKIWFSNEIINR
jgi:hypothetical protein